MAPSILLSIAMPLLRPALLLIALAALTGCDSTDLEPIPDADRTIEFHFQSDFYEDRVIAEINGYRVFDSEVTTDHRLSLAEVAEVDVASGTQRLRVRVGRYTEDATFEVGDEPVYVLVRYQAPIPDPVVEFVGVRVQVTAERPLYD